MKIDISIKNGTSNWFDEDGCDKSIAEIETDNIPRVDDELSISTYNKKTDKWENVLVLVSSICRSYVFNKDTNKQSEFITAYVIKI